MQICYRDSLGHVLVTIDENTEILFLENDVYFISNEENYKIPVKDLIFISAV